MLSRHLVHYLDSKLWPEVGHIIFAEKGQGDKQIVIRTLSSEAVVDGISEITVDLLKGSVRGWNTAKNFKMAKQVCNLLEDLQGVEIQTESVEDAKACVYSVLVTMRPTPYKSGYNFTLRASYRIIET